MGCNTPGPFLPDITLFVRRIIPEKNRLVKNMRIKPIISELI